jgi:hypothetical protein
MVIITLSVTAFFATVSIERTSASSILAASRARTIGSSALAHATSLLAENIPSPNYEPIALTPLPLNGPLTHWWINPGRLSKRTGIGAVDAIDLFSTPVPGQNAGEVNLNARITTAAGASVFPIETSGAPLIVSWVELLRDPSRPRQSDRSQPDYNPVIGRYAFWIDSETNKINFNTALGKGRFNLDASSRDPKVVIHEPAGFYNDPLTSVSGATGSEQREQERASSPLPFGAPTSVNLSSLDRSEALGDLRSVFYHRAFWKYNSLIPVDPAHYAPTLTPRSIKAFVENPSDSEDFWNANRFDVTHRSLSPEFNAFGKPRLLHFLFDEKFNADPHLYSSYQMPFSRRMVNYIGFRNGSIQAVNQMQPFPSPTSLRAWLRPWFDSYQRAASSYLVTPWPGFGASFLDKWAATSHSDAARAEIDQFVLNIQIAAASTATKVDVNYLSGEGGGSDNGKNFREKSNRQVINSWQDSTKVGSTLVRGALSGKGINPDNTPPFINEIGLQVTPRQESASNSNRLYLEFCLKAEYFVPPGYGYGEMGRDVPNLYVAYLQYEVNGAPIVARLSSKTVTLVEKDDAHTNKFLKCQNPIVNNVAQNIIQPGEKVEVATAQTEFAANAGTDNVYFVQDNNAFPTTVAQMRPFTRGQSVTLRNIRLRLVASYPRQNNDWIAVTPTLGRPGQGCDGLAEAPSIREALIALPDVVIPAMVAGVSAPFQTVEVSDPRLYQLASAWTPCLTGESLGDDNSGWIPAQSTKVAFTNGSSEANAVQGTGDYQWRPWASNYPFVSTGCFFTVPTGMQRGIPWATMNLSETVSGSMPPDYLLLDLFAMSTYYTGNHASNGKLNINTRIYPESFGATVGRGKKVLMSAFEGLSVNSQPVDASGIADWIIANEGSQGYPYAGMFMECPLLDAGQTGEYERQALRARMASMFTTQSNSFTVHVLVEAVSDDQGALRPLVRRQFCADVERSIYQGRDGRYGNGATNKTGQFIKKGPGSRPVPGYELDEVDGPDPVEITMNIPDFADETSALTKLEDAYNPVLPYYQYRVRGFRYVTQ